MFRSSKLYVFILATLTIIAINATSGISASVGSSALLTTPTPTPVATQPTNNAFGGFDPGTIDTSGTLAAYNVAPDFTNVVISAALDKEHRDYLVKNAFFVSPRDELEFFSIYQTAQRQNQPILVTTDSLLHSFHLMFDKVLRTAEGKYFTECPSLR